jgi:EAL domain-containing protein (putative c-di-GMP-specific phosphodiesterase class I)/CheY-like chemotaxis protein
VVNGVSKKTPKDRDMESKKNILIIDDEPDFSKTMQFFLENSNFRVMTALGAEEGLEKARLKPDLILLDLRLPVMNGHEVCRRLKEDAATQYIPVIMLTSQSETIDKVEAFGLGAVDYIGKDFPLEEILARIKSAINEVSLATSAEAAHEKNKKILELRKIIDEKNIRILFQPILEFSTKRIIGYEALTRGPQGSIMENPVELFTTANDVNMFFEIDTLCRNMSVKKAVFLGKDNILFLNTDPAVISTDYFKQMEFLRNSLILPTQICIEITERTCIKNFVKLAVELNYFKSMGIKIAIDDVGEGYSSLKAIAELKPEFIKIDIALVRGVDSDAIKSNLAQVIVELAKKVKSHVVAEGVETEGEYKTLLSLGVEYGQGYLFARPSEQV